MAYALKYYHDYCDTLTGRACRIEIEQWGYDGASAEIECDSVPFRQSKNNSDLLKIGHIDATQAVILVQQSPALDFESFWTTSTREYRITHLISGEIDWIGFAKPNGFRYDMDAVVPTMEILAADGLSDLQGILFVEPDGVNYGDVGSSIEGDFWQTLLWTAKEALKKTDLLLPIWTMVDIQALISNSVTSVTQELIRWGDNELRDNPPSTAQRHAELMSIIKPGYKIQVTDGPHVGTVFTVDAVTPLPISSSQIGISITTDETVPSGMSFDKFDVFEVGEATGLVLARRGHFNDVAPSEIGIYKKPTNAPGETAVDFSFLQIGDTLKISESAAGNNGAYTVTGFVNSVPPDSPYIRIQLSPQVPVTIHENVVIEIISQNVDHPDLLAVTVQDVRTYIRDTDIEGKNYYEVMGSAMTAWDVLNNLAKQVNAVIHQNKGRWEIKRINADKVDAGQYEWFEYNSEGAFTGRDPFGDDLELPCVPTRTKWQPLGHPVQMDRVFGAVGVNYRYKYKQEGDSLINMIHNGNFLPSPYMPFPPDLTQNTPLEWKRVYAPTGWQQKPVMEISYALQPIVDGPPGISNYIELSGIPHQRVYLSSYTGYSTSVSAQSVATVMWWQRSQWCRNSQGDSMGQSLYAPAQLVLRIILVDPNDPNVFYMLVNDGLSDLTKSDAAVKWIKYEGSIFQLVSSDLNWVVHSGGYPSSYSDWINIKFKTPPAPITGDIVVEIVGAGAPYVGSQNGEAYFNPYRAFMPIAPGGAVAETFRHFTDRSVSISGLFVSQIVDTGSDEVPLIHPYWYVNPGYTDRIDDIEVMLGDDDSPDHVSNIYVIDGGQTRAVRSWDSWANEFGWGALGLILAKSVMEMYYRPWRLVYGDFVADGIDWSTRIHFEERPGERYVILSGTIDRKNSRFSGVLAQVFDVDTPELPPGGNDGGSTVDPNWQPTGTIRCVRDENGENTGDQEQLEVDMNPSSQTSGQQRWVNIGENTDACPIGQPIDFYWGASTLPIDPATLEYFPYVKDDDNYTMQFSNDGTGKYLVFLWRKSLGTVQSILDVELEETISSWVVESDVMVNGYTYGVMRMSYMTGVFTGLDKTFKIN